MTFKVKVWMEQVAWIVGRNEKVYTAKWEPKSVRCSHWNNETIAIPGTLETYSICRRCGEVL